MADIPVIECVGGTTLRLTCRNQDGPATSALSTLLSGSETLINSQVPVHSGSGMYYAPTYIPKSDAWYVNEWIMVFGVHTYVTRQYIRADVRNS